MFTLLKTDKTTKARLGKIETAHGTIESPFFMPVGTNGVVKALDFEDIKGIGAQLVLSNTYHLYMRPGMDVIKEAGGLHRFMNWTKPILTDSGGYQVFSLTKLRKLKDDGVEFRSHIDGSTHFFTPEMVLDIQQVLGSDMMMPLDICAPYPCDRKEAEHSVKHTTLWAERSKKYYLKKFSDERKQFLFGIIQGAVYEDLRLRSAKEILDIGFDGYAIGGVSVGETVKEMFQTLEWLIPIMPQDKPRYFMGIGFPDQIVKAVGEGIDMFDTCLPTRLGRHASAFTSRGRINISNQEFTKDQGPLDETCDCVVCKNYSRSYLRHLTNSREMTGLKLTTYHNVYFYINLMRKIRKAIADGRYGEFQEDFLRTYNSELIQTK